VNFAMDDDVMELVGSIADFFDRRGDATAIAEATATGVDVDRRRWTELCDMGLPVLLLAEPDGIGFKMLAATAVAERIGAVLLPEPAVATMVLAGLWVAHQDSQQLLEPLCDGSRMTALCGVDVANLDKSGSLRGQVRIVGAQGIDSVALLALDDHTSGAALVVVDFADLGGAIERSTLDPTRPSALVDLTGIEPVEAMRLSDDVCARSRRELVVLTAAELVGGMQRVLDETTQFVSTRQQFGRAIGSFQAIKHKLADMYALTEQARALVQFAALECEQDSTTATSIVGSLARWVPRSAVNVCEDAVHLHGAMGYSWEVDVHLHLRRALATMSTLEDFDGQPIGRPLRDAEAV
jgi:alkylation response protein AidB-like acyl-CoA dehydrogenase